MSDEYLKLKWGTLKSWSVSEENLPELQRYLSFGASASSVLQRDTNDQKLVLCNLIDRINGEIVNDWTGEVMSKDAAKEYIMIYRIAHVPQAPIKAR